MILDILIKITFMICFKSIAIQRYYYNMKISNFNRHSLSKYLCVRRFDNHCNYKIVVRIVSTNGKIKTKFYQINRKCNIYTYTL